MLDAEILEYAIDTVIESSNDTEENPTEGKIQIDNLVEFE